MKTATDKIMASKENAYDIFKSEALKRNLRSTMHAALGKYERKRSISIYPECNPRSDTTAYTDGNSVHVNTLGPLIRTYSPDKESMYYSLVGHVCHECCHILFTDFVESTSRRTAFSNIRKPFEWPQKEPENTVKADEMADFLNSHKNYRKYFAQQYQYLDNIFEDVYIENRMYEKFKGSFSYGQHIANDMLYKESSSVEDMFKDVASGTANLFGVALAMMQLYGLGYTPKTDGSVSKNIKTKYNYERVMEVIEDCKPFTDDLAWQTNSAKRTCDLNEILLRMFSLVDTDSSESETDSDSSNSDDDNDSSDNNDEDQNSESESGTGKGKGKGKKSEKNSDNNSDSESSENDESSDDSDSEEKSSSGSDTSNSDESTDSDDTSGSGNESESSENSEDGNRGNGSNLEDLSEKELKDLIDSLKDTLEKEGADTSTKQGRTKPVDSEEINKDEVEASKRAAEAAEPDSSAKKIFKDIDQEESNEKDEINHLNSLQVEARELLDKLNKAFKNETNFYGYFGRVDPWKYVIHRDGMPSENLYNRYVNTYGEVAPLVETTTRKIEKVLKERERSGYNGGYMFGKFDSKALIKSSYYGDGKVFKRRSNPNGTPKTAFSILVDMSGSMIGQKERMARKTAILLDAVLSKVGLPYAITGFTGSYDTTDMYCFKDYHDSKYDKYRLAGICALNGNRDAAAIAYCCEKLLKVPALKHVLIVISDGCPTELAFQGGDPVEDTKRIVTEYIHKNVDVFGAVIDGNIKDISRIYGNRTLDLRTLSNLPTELVGLVKRYVLR